jgi:aerobic-type carbon monoxide dehydrogenase small subunit (CoxS/CutS family)
MILAAAALLADDPSPDEGAISGRLEGNVCRCGTYPRIVQAVKLAAWAMRKAEGEAKP